MLFIKNKDLQSLKKTNLSKLWILLRVIWGHSISITRYSAIQVPKTHLNISRRPADIDTSWRPCPCPRIPYTDQWRPTNFQQHIVSSCTNDCFWTIRPSQHEMFQIFFMKKWKNMMPIVIWFMFWMMKISELLLRNEIIIKVVSSLNYLLLFALMWDPL